MVILLVIGDLDADVDANSGGVVDIRLLMYLMMVGTFGQRGCGCCWYPRPDVVVARGYRLVYGWRGGRCGGDYLHSVTTTIVPHVDDAFATITTDTITIAHLLERRPLLPRHHPSQPAQDRPTDANSYPHILHQNPPKLTRAHHPDPFVRIGLQQPLHEPHSPHCSRQLRPLPSAPSSSTGSARDMISRDATVYPLRFRNARRLSVRPTFPDFQLAPRIRSERRCVRGVRPMDPMRRTRLRTRVDNRWPVGMRGFFSIVWSAEEAVVDVRSVR